MMEGNNDISLVKDDALGYLSGPVRKNISRHLFGAIHLTSGSFDRFIAPSHIPPSVHI